MWKAKKETQKKGELPSTRSLPSCVQQPRPAKVYVKRQDLS